MSNSKTWEDLEGEGWERHRDEENELYYVRPVQNGVRTKVRRSRDLKPQNDPGVPQSDFQGTNKITQESSQSKPRVRPGNSGVSWYPRSQKISEYAENFQDIDSTFI